MNPRTRILAVQRRPTRAGGYTLMEGLFASVILAASTVGIAGAMTASYATDEHAAKRRVALNAGRQLLDEVATLPMSSSTAGSQSMANFANYSDTVDAAAPSSVLASTNAKGTSSGGSSGGLLDAVGNVVDGVTGLLGGLLGGGSSSSGGSSSTPTTTTPAVREMVARASKVTRVNAATGLPDPAGEFAVVEVLVTPATGGQPIRVSRLVTSAEAESNLAAP